MYYKLCELGTCIEHELDFENVADMHACLRIVHELKQVSKCPKSPEKEKRFEQVIRGIPGLNCLPETIQKMSKVNIPVTDY